MSGGSSLDQFLLKTEMKMPGGLGMWHTPMKMPGGLGMVAHTYGPSTQEAKTEKLMERRSLRLAGQHSEILS